MANVNSYEENLKQLSQNSKEMVELANAFNEATYGNNDSVVMGDGVVLPSFNNIVNRVEKAERTIASFVKGNGVVETDDGTYRKIRVDNVSRPAANITGLGTVSTFTINPNWFFEELQYPRCEVKIDLTNKIEEDSDRVYVNRVIIDTTQENYTTDVLTYISNSVPTYGELIEYLNSNNIEYKEDRDEEKLPLTYERYSGEFQITGTQLFQDTDGISKVKYFLSTVNYSTVSEDGLVTESGNVLTIGDLLRFNNTLFAVRSINQTEKSVTLDYNVGYETPGRYDTLEFYNNPFREKVISVGISLNEVDVVYVKGVNENFNVLSREWSNPVVFYTNELTLDSSTGPKFDVYYTDLVADFGRDLIGRIKEGYIPSYGSPIPNIPVLNADELRVVQINTQLDATLDSERYTEITSEIASVKSNISATRVTIANNKDKLLKETAEQTRITIQNIINTDTDKLNSLTTQFSSLVEELNTLLNDAGAINYSPKYHVRGFFAIPEPKYAVDINGRKAGRQQIIGFETMYRYLHTNETGAALNTFKYTDQNGSEMSGVFTDWNLSVSPFLEKEYDGNTDSYKWVDERVDGSHVVINQIDIPIRSGEKVEIKIRSISEAGYPYNPLKSDWSNSIIIDFPDNLTTDDSVTTILDTVKSDMNSVVLQETLSSAGVYSHLSDGNSQFKHSTDFIEYTETQTDSSGNVSVVTMSLTEKLRSLTALLSGAAEEEPSIEYSVDSPTLDASNTVTGVNTVKGSVRIKMPKDASKGYKEDIQKLFKEQLTNDILPYVRGVAKFEDLKQTE